MWRKPLSLWTRFNDGTGRTRLLWFWQRQLAYIQRPTRNSGPALVLPRWFGTLRLTGDRAVIALASLLPRMNGADCAGVNLGTVVGAVTRAEKGARKQLEPPDGAKFRREGGKTPSTPAWREQRPWEVISLGMPSVWLERADPKIRLALEMAVTEEIERRQLAELRKK